MEEVTPIGFLDVPVLLEVSTPIPRVPWIGFGAIAAVALVVLGVVLENTQSSDLGDGAAKPLGQLTLSAVVLAMAFGIFLSIPILMLRWLKQVKAEQQLITAAGELMQLRRWTDAAIAIQHILSRPVRTLQLRSEALTYLAAILTRYHRFSDAIAVHNHLLDNDLVSPATAYGLKLGRAMAMLREDHLFDADRAISDLRRIGPPESAAFALVDMYRDVKTGHPEEALKIFQDKLPVMRDQLGHRLADGYALAARAYDLLDRKVEAADAFTRATLLAPLIELCRRYPEFQKLVGRYEAAAAPSEMA
jgi:tetratricopeptide (TPR) repeat protein